MLACLMHSLHGLQPRSYFITGLPHNVALSEPLGVWIHPHDAACLMACSWLNKPACYTWSLIMLPCCACCTSKHVRAEQVDSAGPSQDSLTVAAMRSWQHMCAGGLLGFLVCPGQQCKHNFDAALLQSVAAEWKHASSGLRGSSVFTRLAHALLCMLAMPAYCALQESSIRGITAVASPPWP